MHSNLVAETAIPADELSRDVVIADSETLPHIGLVGDTYTVLLAGEDTAGRFCLVDMFIPAGGGPPPHRHDFEETFIVVEGGIEAVFRGRKSIVAAGQTIHIPANAPHQFRNNGPQPARLLCICSPAGQEEFFAELGVPVATRATPPPRPDPATEEAFKAKAASLATKYRTEFLR